MSDCEKVIFHIDVNSAFFIVGGSLPFRTGRNGRFKRNSLCGRRR